jgi:creatinine amidohydrolase
MTIYQWAELTSPDFKAFDPENTVALLAVGAIEQHGPHLPLFTDICLAQAVIAEAAARVNNTLSLLILPALPIGKSDEHHSFQGTLSVSAETLMRLWKDVGSSVARAGIRKLVILNGHGGQTAVTKIVARELRIAHEMLVVPLDWWTLERRTDLFDEDELTHGLHGGTEETSAMLHVRPDLVRSEECRNFVSLSSRLAEDYPVLLKKGVRFAWKAEDLHPEGVTGDASRASAEIGQKVIESASISLAALIEDMARFDQLAASTAKSRDSRRQVMTLADFTDDDIAAIEIAQALQGAAAFDHEIK